MHGPRIGELHGLLGPGKGVEKLRRAMEADGRGQCKASLLILAGEFLGDCTRLIEPGRVWRLAGRGRLTEDTDRDRKAVGVVRNGLEALLESGDCLVRRAVVELDLGE